MKQDPAAAPPRCDVRALQWDATQAGLAWACPYSSSDEFEAAVIRSKLRAGVYGPKRLRRHLLFAGIVTAMLVAICLYF